MTRIRIAFLLVAVVGLILLALLVRTALGSAAAERDLQHRVLADRIVDEMERELTTLLHREEDRPFAHYRFAYLPEPGEGGGTEPVRSPLAEPPSEAFLLCWFQIDPDGTVTSPLRPRDAKDPVGLPGGPPTPEAEALADAVEAAVGSLWAGRRLLQPAADVPPEIQTTGSTIPLPKKKAAKLPEEKVAREEPPAAPERYLEQLNRAIRLRGERQEKLSKVQSANVESGYLEADEPETAAPVLGDAAEEELFRAAPRAAAGESVGRRQADAEDEVRSPLVDVRLEPMVGQALDDGGMVLYRTVLVGDRAYRQGLVIDIPALLTHLEERVLAAGDLAGRARLLPSSAAAAVLPAYSFRHRFADPFGPVVAILALEPLPGLGGGTWIVVLSLLLAASAVLGLVAVYRMVAVVVAYAERRNNFVSAVTHELKTPLTAIRMYGEMLRDGLVRDDARRRRYYATITAEGERLSRLLENVLELSRLERKARPVELLAGDVGEAVEDAAAVLRPHAEKLGFTLRVEAEPGLPPVCFERDALRQVIFNLVDNALKYSREAAEKLVVVHCRREGGGVAIRVADRGPGVERRRLERIFEPFYRGEDELTRTAQGTGIGLALVRGLVERMGGKVWGRNRDGGGFEVVALLPAAELASPAPP